MAGSSTSFFIMGGGWWLYFSWPWERFLEHCKYLARCKMSTHISGFSSDTCWLLWGWAFRGEWVAKFMGMSPVPSIPKADPAECCWNFVMLPGRNLGSCCLTWCLCHQNVGVPSSLEKVYPHLLLASMGVQGFGNSLWEFTRPFTFCGVTGTTRARQGRMWL